VSITYEWRGEFGNAAAGALHAEGFGGGGADYDWRGQVERHNVAWDGGVHAFILDTVVSARARHRGVGTGLVAVATEHARAAGCEWLHVDFDDHLTGFYFRACGFTPTHAGLIALDGP
jgi:GNAT superfamily N-acetyltransferase